MNSGPPTGDIDRDPGLESPINWRRIYFGVILLLILEILAFYLLTRYWS